MKDVRRWVEGKLEENAYSSDRLEHYQLEVSRPSRAPARVLCIGLEESQSLNAEAVDQLLADVPGTGFILAVPTRIEHSAYERAEEMGVCVSGFGELLDALKNDEDISQHVDSQERYERRRLEANRAVQHVKRKGRHAYEVQRRGGLRSLFIVTTNDYEFTADRLYDLIESYEEFQPDLIVVTNPNCRGISTASARAAAQVGIPVILLPDLLDDLGSSWT